MLSLDIDPDLRGETVGFWSVGKNNRRYFRDWNGFSFESKLRRLIHLQWSRTALSCPVEIWIVYQFKGRKETIHKMPEMSYPPTLTDLDSSVIRMMEAVVFESANQVVSIHSRKEWTTKKGSIEIFIQPIRRRR